MATLYEPGLQSFWRRNCYFFLAFFYLSGILAGMYTCRFFGSDFLSLMRRAVRCSVSIVDLLAAISLPFLVSAFIVFICRPSLLLPIAFGKAYLSSAVAFSLMRLDPSGGWLLKSLLCFSSGASASLFYLFWLRHISGDRKFSFWEMFLFLSLAVLIASIDTAFISPFLTKLLS